MFVRSMLWIALGCWPALASGQTTVYSENFDSWISTSSFSGTGSWASGYGADDWQVSQYGRLAANEDDGGGTWGSGDGLDNHMVYSGASFEDYTLNLEVRSTDDDTIGVVFRYQDAQNFYLFFLHGGHSYPSTGTGGTSYGNNGADGSMLYVVTAGVATELASSNRSYGSSWQDLRIEVEGDAINIYFDYDDDGSFDNNEHLINVTDSTHSGGYIGAYCYENGEGHGCRFDNFEVQVADSDGDGVVDSVDNCPDDANPYQEDTDGDLKGDACDADADGDGYTAVADGGDDCDDAEATVNPGVDELCDGLDNNCDGAIDEATAINVSTWYTDADADGYGDPLSPVSGCTQPTGSVADNTDCDDTSGSFYPGAPETCADTLDYNCDGSVSYLDADNDGYPACLDCDDSDPDAYPFNPEVCDGADNDCDGVLPTDEADADGDGISTCEGDCDDLDGSSNPFAMEQCDSVDNDCDGITDEADAVDATTWYLDNDGDGYGDAGTTTEACSPPAQYVSVAMASDCDDTDPLVNPAGTETCNGVDDDCNGVVDEGSPPDATAWYVDEDGDGFGDPELVISACEAPNGYVADGTDCDDANVMTYPGAAELCDEEDNDCNGPVDDGVEFLDWYTDQDEDGYGDANGEPTSSCERVDGAAPDNTDCDDEDALVSPEGVEVWYDGVDQDCDGNDDDQDGDGWSLATDCDDTDAERWLEEDCDEADTGPVDTGPVDTAAVDTDDLDLDGAWGDQKLAAGGCSCESTPSLPAVWALILLPMLCLYRRGVCG